MATLERRKPASIGGWRVAAPSLAARSEEEVDGRGLLAALVLAGMTLRLIFAFKANWLYDEIVYVDFTGHWFSQHLHEYLFQFSHTHYPPRSPIFADPPLPMILYGAAMHVLGGVHLSELLAARLVNVAASALLIALAYSLARKFFSLPAALIAAGFVAFDPVLVALGGSAYTETLAAVAFYATTIALVLLYRQPTVQRYLVLAVCFALGMLMKFVVLLVLIPIAIGLVALVRRRSFPWWSIPAFGAVSFLTAAILWAGARDPSQLLGIYQFIFSIRPDTGVLPHFPIWERGYYYIAMALGTAPAAIAVCWGICAVRAVWLLVRGRVRDSEFLFTLCFFASLAVLPFMVGFSDHHQLGVVLPMGGLMLAGLADRIEWRKHGSRIVAAGVLVVAADTASLYYMPAALWGSFNNVLVGRQASRTVYATGAGEGLETCAKWLNAHTPEDARVAAFAGDWVLRKYLKGRRIALPAFDWDSPSSLATRGPQYIVVPMSFQPDFTRLRTDDGVDAHALFTLRVNGAAYLSVYRMRVPLAQAGRPLVVGAVRWNTRRARTVSGRVASNDVRLFGELAPDAGRMRKPYIAAEIPIAALQGTGLEFRLDRGAGQPLYVDLVEPRSGRFLRAIIPPEYGVGYTSYVSYASMFDPLDLDASVPLAENDFFDEPLVLRFATDGFDERASFGIRDVRFAVAVNDPVTRSLRKMAAWLTNATRPGDRVAVSSEPWYFQSKLGPGRIVLPLQTRDTRSALALQTPRFVVVANKDGERIDAFGELTELGWPRVFSVNGRPPDVDTAAYVFRSSTRRVAPIEFAESDITILNRGTRIGALRLERSGFSLRARLGHGDGPSTKPYLSIAVPAKQLLGSGLTFHLSRSVAVPVYVDVMDSRGRRYVRTELPARLGKSLDPFIAYDDMVETLRSKGPAWTPPPDKPVLLRFSIDGYEKDVALEISRVSFATP